jgi:hypothetical protein
MVAQLRLSLVVIPLAVMTIVPWIHSVDDDVAVSLP